MSVEVREVASVKVKFEEELRKFAKRNRIKVRGIFDPRSPVCWLEVRKRILSLVFASIDHDIKHRWTKLPGGHQIRIKVMGNAPEDKVVALTQWCEEMQQKFNVHFKVIRDKDKRMYSSLAEGLAAMNR